MKPCGKPTVSPHAPSLSVSSGDSDLVRSSGGGVGVGGGGVGVGGENDKPADWTIGVENVIKPIDIVGSVKNDIFIDNISDNLPDEIEYKKIDCDAALTPLKHTKSKHFPKDIPL